ncbi:MAG: hypothetical protein R2712_30475 [Vicinamibacterales bacterium]
MAASVSLIGGRVRGPCTMALAPARARRRSPSAADRRHTGAHAGLRRADRRTGVRWPGSWVGALTLAGLAAGAWHWFASSASGAVRRDPPASHVGGYLVLVGTISILVYGFATCSDIRVATMRYDLLGVMVPVGALVMALQTWRAPTARAALATAVVFWCAFNASDVAALTRERVVKPRPDRRALLASQLEARGVTLAWSAFRTAYHVTFLSREHVRIAAQDFSRILSYQEDATRENAPTVSESPCEGGETLQPGVYLCR